MLIWSRSDRLDDPLLEFVADVVAHELAEQCGLLAVDQPTSNETNSPHDNRRHLRPLLD